MFIHPCPFFGQKTHLDTSPKRTYRWPTDMKIGSTSLIIREMQIKTTMRCHLTPAIIAIINKSTNKYWWGCGERETVLCCWWECRLVQPLWRAVRRYLKWLKLELRYDPVIPLLGIYAKKSKTLIQKNISILIFIAVLFIITKIWKQLTCPSVQEWIKLGHLHNGILLSHKKENFTLCDSMDGPGEY